MPDYNKVILMGHLTRDVELRTAGSSTVGAFGLAVNRKYKTASGEKREDVTFVDCEIWGAGAETLNRYVRKGSPLMLDGYLKLDQWEKDGQKHSKLKVSVENFQFVGGKQDGDAPRAAPASRPAVKVAPTQINEDDIPF